MSDNIINPNPRNTKPRFAANGPRPLDDACSGPPATAQRPWTNGSPDPSAPRAASRVADCEQHRPDDLRVRIRPATPMDAPGLASMHQRLSFNTIRFRYLALRKPALPELEQICRMAASYGRVLVAQRAGAVSPVVGLAYYVRSAGNGPGCAEPAIVVEDAFQGQGIGSVLFRRLTRLAAADGIYRFDAHIHPRNQTIRKLLHRTGLSVIERQDGHGLAATMAIPRSMPEGFWRRLANKLRPCCFGGWDWELFTAIQE